MKADKIKEHCEENSTVFVHIYLCYSKTLLNNEHLFPRNKVINIYFHLNIYVTQMIINLLSQMS